MKVIRLSEGQKLDMELALTTEDFDAIDADTAAYISYVLTNRQTVPKGKLLARTCPHEACVNPAHMVLVDDVP